MVARRGIYARAPGVLASLSSCLLLATRLTTAQQLSSPFVEPDCVSLPVTNSCQQHEWWCWAACGQMVMKFWGKDVSQCEQVGRFFPTQDCCADYACEREDDFPCNRRGIPDFEAYGFTTSRNPTAMTWDQLQVQLYVQREPFVWWWGPADGYGGHMVVVCGYHVVNGMPMLQVQNPEPWCCDDTRDPNPGMTDWSYDAYNSGTQLEEVHLLDIFAYPQGRVYDPSEVKLRRSQVLHWPEPPAPDNYHDPLDAVKAALSGYVVLGTNVDPVPYGFRTSKELANAAPTLPFQLFSVSWADLKGSAKTDARKLLKPTGQLIYPLVANGEVRSSVTVRQVGRTWRLTSFGNARLIRRLTNARTASVERSSRPAKDYFAVQTPGLFNTYMVAHREGRKLMFTPITDDPSRKLRAGVDVDASDTLRKLRESLRKLELRESMSGQLPKPNQPQSKEK